MYLFYYININNIQYSQRIPDCQRHEFRSFFFKKANQANKTNPNLFKYLNGMENMERGEKRSQDDFDPVLLTLYSLR